jgi:CheY-like chemotaxis protein
MKILVVDDHALMREALRGVLKELMYDATVLEAIDCGQALRLIEAHPESRFHPLQQALDGKLRRIDRHQAGVSLGQIQQGTEQLIHSCDGGFDARDQTGALDGAHPAAQLADEEIESVQWLTEIMTRRCEKSRLGEVGQFELPAFLLYLGEQVGVLNCQHGLNGEGLQQIDGVLGEFAGRLSPHDQYADDNFGADERHHQQRAIARTKQNPPGGRSSRLI